MATLHSLVDGLRVRNRCHLKEGDVEGLSALRRQGEAERDKHYCRLFECVVEYNSLVSLGIGIVQSQ